MKKIPIFLLLFIVVIACNKDREDKDLPAPFFPANALVVFYDNPPQQQRNSQGKVISLTFRSQVEYNPLDIAVLKVPKQAMVGKHIVGMSAISVVFQDSATKSVIDVSPDAVITITKAFGADDGGEFNTITKGSQQNRFNIYGWFKTPEHPGKYRMLITELQVFYEENGVLKSYTFTIDEPLYENPYAWIDE